MTSALRFLVDVGVGTSIEQWLDQTGYDTVAVRAVDPHADDQTILAIAVQEQRIVITVDKDFGELVIRSGQPHSGVLLLRMDDATAAEKLQVVQTILTKFGTQLPGRFAVFKAGTIRIQ